MLCVDVRLRESPPLDRIRATCLRSEDFQVHPGSFGVLGMWQG